MDAIPNTKQMASRMLDLPDPFNPVMALNCESHPEITVRVAYDLNPSMINSSTFISLAGQNSLWLVSNVYCYENRLIYANRDRLPDMEISCKSASYYFISHLIEKFTIHKKDYLQNYAWSVHPRKRQQCWPQRGTDIACQHDHDGLLVQTSHYHCPSPGHRQYLNPRLRRWHHPSFQMNWEISNLSKSNPFLAPMKLLIGSCLREIWSNPSLLLEKVNFMILPIPNWTCPRVIKCYSIWFANKQMTEWIKGTKKHHSRGQPL